MFFLMSLLIKQDDMYHLAVKNKKHIQNQQIFVYLKIKVTILSG